MVKGGECVVTIEQFSCEIGAEEAAQARGRPGTFGAALEL